MAKQLLILIIASGAGWTFGQSSGADASRTSETTICQIFKNLTQVDGQVVRLRATVVAGFETLAIIDAVERCGQAIWLIYDGGGPAVSLSLGSSTPAVQRPLVTLRRDDAFATFARFVGATMYPREQDNFSCLDCRRYRVTATLTGRVDVAPAATGFGHLNTYRAQLTLQSVSDVSAEDHAADFDAKMFSLTPIRFPAGTLAGRVLGPDGAPVKHIEVTAYATNKNVPRFSSSRFEWTDDAGSFAIDVPPGEYVVGTNVLFPPAPPFLFAPTFAPGVATREKAVRFTVSDREKLNFTIHISEILTAKTIPVRVLWPDGTPVSDANVWLTEQREPQRVVGLSYSRTRDDGRFELGGFAGIAYVVHASVYTKPANVPHCAEERRIGANEQIRAEIVLAVTRTADACR